MKHDETHFDLIITAHNINFIELFVIIVHLLPKIETIAVQ